MNFFAIAICLACGYLIQCFFGLHQIKDFTKNYNVLKSQGRVAIGRVSGVLRAGAISMFAIDDSGVILDGSYMMGVTIFAKFKSFSNFNGENIADLKEEKFMHLAKPLRKCILDAVTNYNIYTAGGEIPEKLSPFQKVNNVLKKNEDKK